MTITYINDSAYHPLPEKKRAHADTHVVQWVQIDDVEARLNEMGVELEQDYSELIKALKNELN